MGVANKGSYEGCRSLESALLNVEQEVDNDRK